MGLNDIKEWSKERNLSSDDLNNLLTYFNYPPLKDFIQNQVYELGLISVLNFVYNNEELLSKFGKTITIETIRENFILFAQFIEPHLTFYPVHIFVCDLVQKAWKEKDGRQLLSIAPGAGKSTITSCLFPSFILGNNPKEKIMVISYGGDLSRYFGKNVRRYVDSPEFKALFPTTEIEGQGKSENFITTVGGSFQPLSKGGSITGFRCSTLLIDDMIKNAKEASSETILEDIWDWYTTTAESRLVKDSSVIGFSTRWSKKDLIGRLAQTEGFNYTNIPALSEGKRTDPLNRRKGESLGDYYKTKDQLEKIRTKDTTNFNRVYQGIVEESYSEEDNKPKVSTKTFLTLMNKNGLDRVNRGISFRHSRQNFHY